MDINKKREEIREGIAFKLFELDGGTKELWGVDWRARNSWGNKSRVLMHHLHSEGCVLWDNDLDCRVPLIEE